LGHKETSQQRIGELSPIVAAKAREWYDLCWAEGIRVYVVCGYRSKDQQAVEYGKGRSQATLNALGYSHIKAQPNAVKVTNAKPGTSMHQYRLALDYCLLDDKCNAIWTVNADWKRAATIAKKLGFFWGAEFKSLYDPPHLEMTFGLTVKDLMAGKTPPTKLQEEDDELSAEEKKELTALRSEIKALSDAVAGLVNSKDVLKEQSLKQAVEINEMSAILLELTNTSPPVWSQEALQAFACTPSVLNGKPVIDTPGSATYAEARLITILHRLGLAAQQKGDK
jgi:peptidoglycan LD-endopeptidase CwlK